MADSGRSTGHFGQFIQYGDNHGPLVRANRMGNNGLNGMEVRGGTLTAESVWDDADIVHVLTSEIVVDNVHIFGGLRLQSSETESLVIKLFGPNAGFTANGTPLDIEDRIGGSVQVIGTPGHPVVLTSLRDDSVGAGLDLTGQVMKDTNNDGSATLPNAGDWRSIRLTQFSNDRNSKVVNEIEQVVTNGGDPQLNINRTLNLGSVPGRPGPGRKERRRQSPAGIRS